MYATIPKDVLILQRSAMCPIIGSIRPAVPQTKPIEIPETELAMSGHNFWTINTLMAEAEKITIPLNADNIMAKDPLACKNHISNGQAEIDEAAIIIFLFILSARYPPIKPPILPLIRKTDMVVPHCFIESPFSVKSIDIKLIKLVITTERVNIIKNIIHRGHDLRTKKTFTSDRFTLFSFLGTPSSVLINIIARMIPGKDNNHSLLKPPDDTINVIITGATASPIHPTIRKIDITNVDLFLLKPATVAAPLG